MKKILLILALVAVLALGVATMASADGGPHGGYTATTDACAGCHRAHTATGPKLLVQSNAYNLCISCHGSTGTGADTNVEDGFFLSTRSSSTEGAANTDDVDDTNTPGTPTQGFLLGGGFSYYKGAAVTSTHDPSGTTDLAWGNGVTRGVTVALSGGNLTCISCHDPHGSSNYRIIKETINGVSVSVAQVDEGAAKDYDTEQWGSGQSNVCAACHSAYHQTAQDQGSTLDAGTYTHRIDMPWNTQYAGTVNPETVGVSEGAITYTLPLAQTGAAGGDVVVCQTCHLPHGTSAEMSGYADSGGLPGNTSSTDSALLRLDNRGVCQVCHQK